MNDSELLNLREKAEASGIFNDFNISMQIWIAFKSANVALFWLYTVVIIEM